MRIEDQTKVLRPSMFDWETGRFNIRELSRYHIARGTTRSPHDVRIAALTDWCDGMHVNMIRDQGLGMLEPLVTGEWTASVEAQLKAKNPEAPLRVSTGKSAEVTAASLPGFGEAPEPLEDPLAIEQQKLEAKREARRAKAKEMWAKEFAQK